MKKLRITEKDYLKAIRRASRDAEIELHGKPAGGSGGTSRVHRSKRAYDRKKSKADLSKDLP